MAALTEVVTQVPILASNKKHRTINNNTTSLEKINSINDLILYQAQCIPDVALIAYPYPDNTISDFAEYSARDLNQFTDRVAIELSTQGLRPAVSRPRRTMLIQL